jgi:hypothetical protein
MSSKRIQYSEGQWFAVPLRKGGYALGVVVRGNYKTKIVLGYFFGPKFDKLPGDNAILDRNPENAILITWFGDLGITNGSWPLIQSTRRFSREEWPMPKFGRRAELVNGKGIIVEYKENDAGEWRVHYETPVNIDDINGLPEDSISYGGAVEIRLTKLLDGQ